MSQVVLRSNLRMFTYLIKEEVIDVVGEESSELALLGLAGPHVHFYLLNESGKRIQHEQLLKLGPEI